MWWRRNAWLDAPADGSCVQLAGLASTGLTGRIKWKKHHDHRRALSETGTLPLYERRYADILGSLSGGSLHTEIAREQLRIVRENAEPRAALDN